ncbi:MAG: outer membrane beta-barrel protein [Flavisolibacter sp.]
MYFKHYLLYLLVFFGAVSFAKAQETTVRFKIHNQKNQPLSFATVTVLPIPDTVRLQQAVSDSNGLAGFILFQNKPYIIRISAVNHKSLEKNITVKGDNPVYNYTLEPSSETLSNVVVTAVRPMMRQEDDKTIVDPETLAAVSTNAFEILEKTPGIFLDQDGNLYLNSTTPSRIYINGREQKMSAADIATMLKNLPPNAIGSIEIMRTPSSRYDASGGGGIVNIILKKGVKLGLTGSVTTGMNQEKYGNQFAGISLNNNNGGLSTYLNLNYSRRGNFEELNSDRFFASDSVLNQESKTKYFGDNYYVGIGASYELSKKWELSYDGRFSYNNNNNNSTNYSKISKISTGELISSGRVDVRNRGHNSNFNQGFNAKYKIDTIGSEWTTDIAFTYTPGVTVQEFTNGDGYIENDLKFFSAQTNFLKKLKGQLTLETGLKSTAVRFNNVTDYYKLSNGSRTRDLVRSGIYDYRESINSAYLQMSKNFKGIIVKVGTRVENTNMIGHQRSPVDTSFEIHRTDPFPYIYISKTIMKIAGYDLRAYLVYRRTISRPAYEYLNPSVRFVDPFLYETGNPTLRPQFMNNYEANISVDERPIIAIGILETKDIFTQVIYPADSAKIISIRTYDNLGSNKETYLRMMAAIPPGGKYFGVVWAQYNHNFYNGLYENQPLLFKRGSWTLFTYHSLKITKLTQFYMSGFVRFNGQQQFYELETFGELRASINQQFFKKKLNVSLSASDILRTNKNEFYLNQGSILASGMRRNDTHRFGINLRYNFGIKKKEENNNIFNMEPDRASN